MPSSVRTRRALMAIMPPVVAGAMRMGGLPRYRCGACGKTFNALTKPHLARLRRREFWPEYARSMIAGDKVRVAAGRCEGSQEHLPPLAAPVSGHTVRGQASASAWHRES